MSEKDLKSELNDEELDKVSGGGLGTAPAGNFMTAMFTDKTKTKKTNTVQKGARPKGTQLGAAPVGTGSVKVVTTTDTPTEGRWV